MRHPATVSPNSDCRYGEKAVQGSPYPRSYYRCIFKGCGVRKAVERHPAGGHVSSTVYRVWPQSFAVLCNISAGAGFHSRCNAVLWTSTRLVTYVLNTSHRSAGCTLTCQAGAVQQPASGLLMCTEAMPAICLLLSPPTCMNERLGQVRGVMCLLCCRRAVQQKLRRQIHLQSQMHSVRR